MKRLFSLVILIGIGYTGWYLAAPLFIDQVVEEEFPMAMEDKKEMEMLEELTQEDVDAMPEEEKKEMMDKMQEMGEKMPDKVMEDPEPTGPVLLSSGSFRGADALHKGSGTASIYALEDGSHVLRFENFSVTNGPALSVYLTKSADGSRDAGYTDLGKLKGNKGSQNYTLPADINPSEYQGVLIYCVPFRVEFATAGLR